MPGRLFASWSKPDKVADPVPHNLIASTIFMASVAASAYGTWYVSDHVLPKGAGRKVAASTGEVGSYSTLEGMQDYIVGAIPFFFILMGIEAVLIYFTQLKSVGAHYCAVDTWSSLAAGSAQTLIQMLARPFWPMNWIYCYLWDHYRLTDAFGSDASWIVACLGFVVGDFSYYWYHRHAHEIHFLWAGHNTHHSSEHYNLSTALRQSWQQALLSGIWALPAAAFMPPRTFMLCQQWVTLYQFWIHTCVVRRLPWVVELIFSTPSHHRMHHDRRLHKNFAGIFIVWDRLFGTFQDETADTAAPPSFRQVADPLQKHAVPRLPVPETDGDEIAYFGITDPIKSWADVIPQQLIWEKIRRHGRGPVSLIRNAIVGPGYSTSTSRRPLPSGANDDLLRLRIDVSKIGAATRITVSLLFTWVLFGLIATVINGSKMDVWASTGAASFLLVSLCSQGLIYDKWPLAFWLEIGRCAFAILYHAQLPFDYCAEWHLLVATTLILFRPSIFN